MQVFFNILYTTSIYFLLGYSFYIIYSAEKFFNLSHAILFTLGAYFTYFFQVNLKLDFYIAAILTIILVSLFNLSFYLLFDIFKKRNTLNFIYLILSLGIYIIIQNLISIIFGDKTISFREPQNFTTLTFGKVGFTKVQLITILIALLLILIYQGFLRKTKIFLLTKAISDNLTLSSIVGVDVKRTFIFIYLLGGVIASITGILIACDKDMYPTMGFNLFLYGVVAMIIGGIGSTWGLVGGSLLLATAQHLGAYYIDSKWMDAIAYIILILFLIWKPLGFSGKHLKKIEI